MLYVEQTRSLRELSKNEAGRVGFNDTSFQRKRKSRYQPPVTVKQVQPTSPVFFPSQFSKEEDFLPITASPVVYSKQRTHKEPIVPILIEDSSEEEEEENIELEKDGYGKVEEAEDDCEIDDGEIEYEEDGDEIYYAEEEDEILQLPLEEDDQLLDDAEEQVEEEQKQEMKGPPVFVILDSSDED